MNLPLTKLLIAALLLIPSQALAVAADWEGATKSVVRIICSNNYGASTGTGWSIDGKGHFITNNHVINCAFSGNGKIYIALGKGKANTFPAYVLWRHKRKDLAIITSKRVVKPRLTISATSNAKVGDNVTAIGFPGVADALIPTTKGFFVPTLTNGSIGRIVDSKDRVKVIQMNAEINAGNSGGPLFNDCGQVVGINSFGPNYKAFLQRGQVPQGMGFAVTIDELLPALKKYKIDFLAAEERCSTEKGRDPLVVISLIVILAVALGSLYLSLTQRGRTIVREAKNAITRTITRTMHGSAPASEKSKPMLKGVKGSFEGSELELNDEKLAIGRDPRLCQLVFPADIAGISKRHAELTFSFKENCFYLEDCWSTNGTFIVKGGSGAGKRMEPGKIAKLMSGDQFYLDSPNQLFEVLFL